MTKKNIFANKIESLNLIGHKFFGFFFNMQGVSPKNSLMQPHILTWKNKIKF